MKDLDQRVREFQKRKTYRFPLSITLWAVLSPMLSSSIAIRAFAQNQVSVHGIVTDARTHTPIQCAVVSAVGDQAAAPDCTDAAGQFDIVLNERVKIGDQIRIRAQKANYSSFDKKAIASPNQIIQIELVPIPSARARTHTANRPLNSTQITHRDAFAFDIPFLMSNMGDSGIDVQALLRTGSADKASELAGIASFRSEFGRIPAQEQVHAFLAKLLEYYLSREVFAIQDPKPPVLISYNSNSGQTTHVTAPIDVPDAGEYSKTLWLSQIDSLGLQFNPHHGGASDAWAPQVLCLPSGMSMKWMDAPAAKGFTLRYQKLSNLIFDIEVEFSGQSSRTLPPRGPFPNQTRTLVEVGVAVMSDFRWQGDRAQGKEYRTWAKDISAGLKSRLAPARPEHQ